MCVKKCSRLCDDLVLTKQQATLAFQLFERSFTRFVSRLSDKAYVERSEIVSLLNDAMDTVACSNSTAASSDFVHVEPEMNPEGTSSKGKGRNVYVAVNESKFIPDPKPFALEVVEWENDPRIWGLLDEGCNSSCHSAFWHDIVQKRLAITNHTTKVVDGKVWTYSGIGKAECKLKREIPVGLRVLDGEDSTR